MIQQNIIFLGVDYAILGNQGMQSSNYLVQLRDLLANILVALLTV